MAIGIQKERDEAICAGQNALECLKEAKRELNGAESWGVYDILGGGMLSKLIKHNKINNAALCIEEAQRCIEQFYQELKDLSEICDVDLEISEFAVFCDFFLDHTIGDFFMQYKIEKAKRLVDEAIMRTGDILNRICSL